MKGRYFVVLLAALLQVNRSTAQDSFQKRLADVAASGPLVALFIN